MDNADRTMDDFKIELFIFPDGTQVEMMVFDRPTAGAVRPATSAQVSCCAVDQASASPTADEDADVHVCPVCRSDFVQPVDWRRTGEATWDVRLRCPECEAVRDVALQRPAVERLSRDLYHGAQELAREAQRVGRRNFEDEARRFIIALQRGDIQPLDF